jgi:hypothetical protein
LVSRIGRGRERFVRMGFFVGCKSWERKRTLCENGGFLLVARVGRGEKGAKRKGDIYGQRNPLSHY